MDDLFVYWDRFKGRYFVRNRAGQVYRFIGQTQVLYDSENRQQIECLRLSREDIEEFSNMQERK